MVRGADRAVPRLRGTCVRRRAVVARDALGVVTVAAAAARGAAANVAIAGDGRHRRAGRALTNAGGGRGTICTARWGALCIRGRRIMVHPGARIAAIYGADVPVIRWRGRAGDAGARNALVAGRASVAV